MGMHAYMWISENKFVGSVFSLHLHGNRTQGFRFEQPALLSTKPSHQPDFLFLPGRAAAEDAKKLGAYSQPARDLS